MINESLGSFDTPAWMGEIRAWPRLPESAASEEGGQGQNHQEAHCKAQGSMFPLGVCWPAKAREAAQDHGLELRDKPETGQMVLTGRPETRGGIHRLLKQEVLGIRSGM